MAGTKYEATLKAAHALESRVFLPKLESAQHLEDAFGSANWTADGSNLVTDTGVLVVSTSSGAVSSYLSEYDPASVRRASESKRAAVTSMRTAIADENPDAVASARSAFMNLVREYKVRAGLTPEHVEQELS